MDKTTRKQTLLTPAETSLFCGQIALILKSGISSLEGISVMLEDSEAPEEISFLSSIYEKLLETGNFTKALTGTGRFPRYMLQMTDIGEQTGTLDEVMEHLSSYYEREDSIARSLRNALTYPLIMSAMMIVVLTVLLVKVMPIFNQVFIQLGTEMTGLSGALLHIGELINRYSLLLILLVCAVIGIILFCSRTAAGQKLFLRLCYKLPLFRQLYAHTASCRFAGGMALTLGSGLDTHQSLQLAASLNEDPVFSKKLDCCFREMAEGNDLYHAIHTAGIFSGVYTRMASLGEKTGTMDHVMERIAGLYRDDVDERINNLLALLEPTLVILLSLLVGIILLSVMLPLIGIMSAI
ncbi:MAG: type II secretion system F family protein [Lachnospiraceae bacterium]|nr:type II secretion system F family protein [Lachnospiraceae bacterium]